MIEAEMNTESPHNTMEQKDRQERWLPHLNQELAVRVNGLLKTTTKTASDAPTEAEQLIRYALQDALDRRATDIHFEPFSLGWRVRFRLDGRLHDVAQLTFGQGQRAVRYLKTLAGLDPVTVFLPEDASARVEVLGTKLDLRLAFAPAHDGETLAVRILNPNRIRHRIADLGVSREDITDLERWLSQITGMCLVTGPAGSGKTTTLYALLHELELSDNAIITIEDPIEYAIDGITQIQVNHAHGLTFAEGLKAMLRLDPDFLLVGEMRDAESARTAVEAAASGHVMMSTLHSPDAMGVVSLLRNWGVADHQIATVLEIVISQRLVRRLCTKCRSQGVPTAAEQYWLESLNLPVPEKSWHAKGCEACLQTGYSGCIGVFEIWRKTESDYELLLDHTDEHSLRRHLRERGRKTVLEDGLIKAREGITSLVELKHMGALTTFHDESLSRKRSVRSNGQTIGLNGSVCQHVGAKSLFTDTTDRCE